MVKNKLESKWSESYRATPNVFWGMKLQNNMLAHTVTPADFLIHFERKTISLTGAKVTQLFSNLVEAKQVTCEPGENGRLAFKRLKQMHDLLSFESFSNYHRGFFLVGFIENKWDNSEVYLVPVKALHYYIDHCVMASINRETFKICFHEYLLSYEKGLLDASQITRSTPWNVPQENNTL